MNRTGLRKKRRTLRENMPILGFVKRLLGFLFMSLLRLAFMVLLGVMPLCQRK